MRPEALAPDSKYRLIRPLGAGGMGTVYLAHDTALNRDVALKFIGRDLLTDGQARKRLVREARAAAALDHPAICSVYDIELNPQGEACIVMQYVEGETLAARLQRGPLPVRDAIAVITEIAQGLAEAHRQGVIHRDLKPQNIMVTPSGRAKLLDFGIATLADSTMAATTTTATDALAGTPPYMSPEQITQQAVDRRSDLFSLGCVLYECLTGRRAFGGQNALEIAGQVLHVHPPPPSNLRPGLQPELDEICRRLLAKDPADRFQSADELLGALLLVAPDTAGSVAPSPPRRRRWTRGAIGMVLAAAAVGGLATWRVARAPAVPSPPANAARWYAQGTDSIREGAYHSAKLALNQAIALHPAYPQAYIRLAEALIALDEPAEARAALLQANSIAAPSRLPAADRDRNEAVQALVLREPEAAVRVYRRLVDREPRDAGSWLDLGRAQEAAGHRAEARRSFEQALTLDRTYAAAHLRLGALEAQEGRRQQALAAFEEAERLYRTIPDLEGETEALLQKGAFLDSLGEVGDAREALQRARALAETASNQLQALRAELRLSSVIATEGRFDESLKLAEGAVRAARAAGLETIAADGLIEFGSTLTAMRQSEAADLQFAEAIAIAERQKAEGVALRAMLNRASLWQTQGRSQEAITLARRAFDAYEARREPRKALSALAIIARCHENLEQYGEARDVARRLLTGADALSDDYHRALAFVSLAVQATVSGQLPDALDHRVRAEEIHRSQADAASLAFDLANRAELLIRLGRGEEAEDALQEIEAEAARGNDAYAGRRRRVLLLRAIHASVMRRFDDARRYASQVLAPKPPADLSGAWAAALEVLAGSRDTRSQARAAVPPAPTDGTLAARREVRYWQLAAALERGGAARVLEGVHETLQQVAAAPSDEFEWRVAALGAAAAARSGDVTTAQHLRARAGTTLATLRRAWGAHAAAYDRRPDLTELRRRAGL